MFKTVFCTTLALVAGSAVVAFADAKDDATAAAQKLTTGGNYSWKQTVESAGGGGGGGRRGGGGGGPQEGKVANGVIALTTQAGGNPRTVYIKSGKVVTQNADGQWQTAEEAAAARANNAGNAGNDQGAAGGRRGRGGRGGRGGAGGGMANFKLPSETLADMLGKTKSLASADGAIKGDLTDEAAKSLVAGGGAGRGRRNANADANAGGNAAAGPEVTNPKATLTIWISNGAVSKYQTHATGSVTGRNGNAREVDRTTTVEFTDVGSTKVDVPAEAAKKLG